MVKKAAEATPNHLLRAARQERGWTQKEVADRIGSPQSFNISRWEQGTAFPSAHYIQKLCLLFGKSARELGLLLEEPPVGEEPTRTESDSLSLWNVPYRRNPFFTGREGVLRQLHDRLIKAQSAALTQTQAISGLGGIGKTQIAVEYAYRHREEYSAVFWVRAASRDTLISDYMALAALLHLPEENEQDQNKAVAAVKHWLASRQGWLLILDNADDLDLVVDFLPTGNSGHILLTTRAQATGGIAFSIEVEKMEPDEGALLLLRRAKILAPDILLDAASMKERTSVVAIVEAMDGLPLALDQAAAYIEETGCGLIEYFELFQRHRRDLLSRLSGLSGDYPESIETTWSLAFRQVERANPLAHDLLHLCAFLHPDGIPERLFSDGAAALDDPLRALAKDAYRWNEVLEVLRKYSLVRRHARARILTMHRLVQTVLRDTLDGPSQRLWAHRAMCLVSAAFPSAELTNWQCCQDYLSHAQACAELIEEYQLTSPEVIHLLTHMGAYLRERAIYAQAEFLLQRALAISEQARRPEHLDTAETLNHLALLYWYQGKYEQAEPLLQRALMISGSIPGPEHSITAETLNHLALLYYYQGRYTHAEPLYQRALTIFEQALGPGHPYTTKTLANLALLYQYQGRYEQAEPLLQRALALDEQTLGHEHPQTINTLQHLAFVFVLQGRYAEAEPLLQQAMTLDERILGSDHPDTAYVLINLARLYIEQGRYGQAEALLQRALMTFEQRLVPEHPDTAYVLNNLARLYIEQGHYKRAKPLLQRALAISEQGLGPEHPDTAYILVNLALLDGLQDYYERAEQLLQRALTIFEQRLWHEHPFIATILVHRAHFYESQGRYAQAEPLLKRALALLEQSFGPEHFRTTAVLKDLTRIVQKKSLPLL